VWKVIASYEKARRWIIANPEETAKLIAEEAKLPLSVAKLQLSRNDFSNAIPGDEHAKALKAAGSILIDEELVRRGANVNIVVDELIEPTFAKAVVR
jgi:sulfonate transport system substrate-binding protein